MTVYFLYHSYNPGTASCTRMMTYLNTINKENFKITLCFLAPDDDANEISNKYDSISIIYLWKTFYIPKIGTKNGKLKTFLYHLSLVINSYRFRSLLKKGDIVYTYSLLPALPYIMGVKGVKYYNEHTEYPPLSGLGAHLFKISFGRCIEYLKRLDGVIVISPALKKLYEDKGLDSKKIHIVNMTVDTNRFDGISKKNNPRQYIAYCGANFTNEKDGVIDLIKSYSLIYMKYDNTDLLLVGNPSEKTYYDIERIVFEKGLKGRVSITGRISPEEVPEYLKTATILALARPDNLQAKYGFPTKLGEYLLTGNPVVSTNVGDIHEYLIDNEDIMLTTPGDIEEFANKLSILLDDKKKAETIGFSGRKKAMSLFNGIIETEKLINILYGKNEKC